MKPTEAQIKEPRPPYCVCCEYMRLCDKDRDSGQKADYCPDPNYKRGIFIIKIIYISGRYRSRTWLGKVWNIYRARRAAQRLWERGWVVICPHMNTALFKEDGIPYIAGDCEIIKRCVDAIYMLKGYESSEGAMIELATAKIKGIEVIYEKGNIC